jgi:signal transduction histidine kinase
MKYLYQQLLAFAAVIILILLIVGVSFTQLTRNSLVQNNYGELERYAKSVQQNAESSTLGEGEVSAISVVRFLTTSEQVLENQEVHFYLVTKNSEMFYPPSDVSPTLMNISKQDWEQLSEGKEVRKTSTLDFYKRKQESAYVMVPYYQASTNKFYGTLVVTKPTRYIQESMEPVMSNLFKGFLLSSVVAFLISYFFAQFQVNRINRMKKATQEISSGNFDVQLPIKDKDELGELAHDFNSMAHSLKVSQIEIERQEDRRKQFMADASHEMRTPLTTINGLLEGLEYDMIPEHQKKNAIHLMKNETNRLIRLVKENLDYEKIRTGQITMMIKRFNGTKTLQTLMKQLNGKAEEGGNKLLLDTTKEVEVYADYDRFVQIMVNILTNATQFTTNGEIHVKIEENNQYTIVTISDNGIGMNEEAVRNIWDRYYKVDPSRVNSHGESGLGLPIVQQLVKLHNGKIELESKEGVGTTFKIYFPISEDKSGLE